MHLAKTIPAIMITSFILVACGAGSPSVIPTTIATNTLQPGATAEETQTIVSTPTPNDVPVYKTSFEDVADLEARGITPIGNSLKINTENTLYGNKSIELYGTLPGAQWSAFTVEFNIQKMTGEGTIDLSNKTFNISMFIPMGSPIDGMGFAAKRGDKSVLLAIDTGITQGTWNDFEFDVKNIYEKKSWINAASQEEAVDIIEHCQAFQINGSRSVAGDSTSTNLLVDDLQWIGISDVNHIPIDDNVDSLRKYAANEHFRFGLLTSGSVFLNNPPGRSWYAYMAAQEGTITTVWNFAPMENEDYSKYDYGRPEDAGLNSLYQFAEGNHMTTMGYEIGGLYGESNVPQWIQDLAFPDATKAELLYHVEKDLRYTQGKNPVWFIFNEAAVNCINSFDTGCGLHNRQLTGPDYSPWAANINESSLIKAAFLKANEIDSGAILMMNDGGGNEGLDKANSDFYFQFASDLKAQGIPIDGVGFQTHNLIDPEGNIKMCHYHPHAYNCTIDTMEDMETYLKDVEDNVKRYAGVGLKVAFTEVDGFIKIDDIDLNTQAGKAEYGKRLQWQAKYYAGLLKIAIENENVVLFHSWMVTDKFQDSTGPAGTGYGNGAILDIHNNPKPAYDAMLELLKNN